MKSTSQYIIVTAAACIVACVGEFVTLFVFGAFYPGYNHLKDTMSALGSSVSPVSDEISIWWVIMGLLFIFFGTGFRKAFTEKRQYTRFAALLIMLYGFGEGIGSGVFKSNRIANELTTSGIIHDIFGGIGVAAILLFPLIMQKLIARDEMPVFSRMSKIVFITGIITFLLFSLRYLSNDTNFITLNKGLWQRLFMLNSYIYLTTVAILMIKRNKKQKISLIPG